MKCWHSQPGKRFHALIHEGTTTDDDMDDRVTHSVGISEGTHEVNLFEDCLHCGHTALLCAQTHKHNSPAGSNSIQRSLQINPTINQPLAQHQHTSYWGHASEETWTF